MIWPSPPYTGISAELLQFVQHLGDTISNWQEYVSFYFAESIHPLDHFLDRGNMFFGNLKLPVNGSSSAASYQTSQSNQALPSLLTYLRRISRTYFYLNNFSPCYSHDQLGKYKVHLSRAPHADVRSEYSWRRPGFLETYTCVLKDSLFSNVNDFPAPALFTSKTELKALKQATRRVPELPIEGPCTEGFC